MLGSNHILCYNIQHIYNYICTCQGAHILCTYVICSLHILPSVIYSFHSHLTRSSLRI